jgi:hypothetical protein
VQNGDFYAATEHGYVRINDYNYEALKGIFVIEDPGANVYVNSKYHEALEAEESDRLNANKP